MSHSITSTSNQPIPLTAMPLVAPSALLQAHLQSTPPIRISGRQVTQARKIDLNTGSLTHCNGSALVKIDQTTIICGVRAEILPVSEIPSYSADARDPVGLYNLLVTNIDLSTGCSPFHAMNSAPSLDTQALTQRIYSLLLPVVSSEDLEIRYTLPSPSSEHEVEGYKAEESVKAYWTLYIDMVCISYGGAGVAFDAAVLAAYAALRDTILPYAWWDGDDGVVLCDADISRAKKLKLESVPVPLSFGVFETKSQAWTLVDCDSLEEECCQERGCVVVDALDGKILRIEKMGGGVLDDIGLQGVLGVLGERARDWLALLRLRSDS